MLPTLAGSRQLCLSVLSDLTDDGLYDGGSRVSWRCVWTTPPLQDRPDVVFGPAGIVGGLWQASATSVLWVVCS